MSYSLEQFCVDCRDTLCSDIGSAGKETIRVNLEKLLINEIFILKWLLNLKEGRTILHHDTETGIYINGHRFNKTNHRGKPHDHGDSWAVYGQAIGFTEMTTWSWLEDRSTPHKGRLTKEETFSLKPGKAVLFDTGIIHSTAHPEPARWVRITGANLDVIERFSYDPEENFKLPIKKKGGFHNRLLCF